MIRAVIDQKAFEQLVSGKSVTIQGTALRLVSGDVDVELILSDIGFESMMACIRQAAVLPQVPIVDSLDVVMRHEREREETIGRLYLMEHGWETTTSGIDGLESWTCPFRTRQKWPDLMQAHNAVRRLWDLDEAVYLQQEIDYYRAAVGLRTTIDDLKSIKIEWNGLGLRCRCRGTPGTSCYICAINDLLSEALPREPRQDRR